MVGTAAPPDVSSVIGIIDWLMRGGAVVALFALLFGGYYELWYYGPSVRRERAELKADNVELKKERDECLKLLLETLRDARKLVSASELDAPHGPRRRT